MCAPQPQPQPPCANMKQGECLCSLCTGLKPITTSKIQNRFSTSKLKQHNLVNHRGDLGQTCRCIHKCTGGKCDVSMLCALPLHLIRLNVMLTLACHFSATPSDSAPMMMSGTARSTAWHGLRVAARNACRQPPVHVTESSERRTDKPRMEGATFAPHAPPLPPDALAAVWMTTGRLDNLESFETAIHV